MSDSRTEISVIVPFLNEERYIERCIASLLAQDIDPTLVELIFVDNNSTDASVSIVTKYPQIKLVREQTPQVYAARNTATEYARGTILAFTDADCEVSSNWLTSIFDQFKSGKVDIVLGERDFSENASFMSQFLRDYENMKIQFILKEENYRSCFGYTNNMAIDRRVYNQLGGFREDIPLADTDFVRRYIKGNGHPRVGYSYDAHIRHLEIGTWSDWMRKLALYGRQSPESEIPLYLSWTRQIRLYHYAVKALDYSLFRAALFVLAASCANAVYLLPYLLNGGRKLTFRDRSA